MRVSAADMQTKDIRVASNRGDSGKASGRFSAGSRGGSRVKLTDADGQRVGDIRADQHRAVMLESYRHYLKRIIIALVAILAVVICAVLIYRSPLFSVTSTEVDGEYFLTESEVLDLADLGDTTLLRLDTAGIEAKVDANPWVASCSVSRIVPHTVRISITEKPVAALVETPITATKLSHEKWLIASDGTWLAKVDTNATDDYSKKVAAASLDVPLIDGVATSFDAQEGSMCTDESVLNALGVLSSVSTDLSSQISSISVASVEQTTLTLDNGVDVAFGSSAEASSKERIILQLLAEHEGNISYINVRVIDRPAWRGLTASS